jgi:hypothetical protein
MRSRLVEWVPCLVVAAADVACADSAPPVVIAQTIGLAHPVAPCVIDVFLSRHGVHATGIQLQAGSLRVADDRIRIALLVLVEIAWRRKVAAAQGTMAAPGR